MVKRKREDLDLQALQARLQDIVRIQTPGALARVMPAAAPELAPIYQLKITLRYIRPPIWRRVQVPSDITLAKLHRLIQVVMGWTDSHLHYFEAGGVTYGLPDPDVDYDLDVKDSRRVRLAKVAPEEKAKMVYEYDFGDSWMHDILVEKILPPDPDVRLPICLKGRRACPPEDCGGPWGYVRFLEIIHDPEDPEYEEMREWYGGDFDAEAFDAAEINRELQEVKW